MINARAKRLPNDGTLSGWYDILPTPPEAAPLAANIKTQWLIIGGGITGLSAARRLSQLCDDSITVIDAQPIGWGAAGRNSGFMIDLPHDLQSDHYAAGLEKDITQIRLNRAAIAFGQAASDEYGLSTYFKAVGKYHGAANAAGLTGLRKFQSHLDSLDEPYTAMDAADFKQLTGSEYYKGGLFTPGAVLVQPAGYVLGLAQGLKSRVCIYENTPALAVQSGEKWHEVQTPNGTVRCRNIILANNGQIESFGLFKRRLLHIHLFASMSRELTSKELARLGGQHEWGLIPALPMGTTVRKHDRRIVVRNHISYTPAQKERSATNTRSAQRHLRSFEQRFPMLDEVSMQYHWAGALCLSLNSVSAFGEVAPRVYAAACQNGLGLTNGTLSGMLIAEHAMGVESEALSHLLAQPQPKKLPPAPLVALGAPARMWWGQRQAGLDL